MERCPLCKKAEMGKYWCRACHAVFVCPNPQCGAPVAKPPADSCSRCGLLFEDYILRRKMYRLCPKCRKKQGIADAQCRCGYWFNCPTCGHRVVSTSMLSCPRCATRLR
ncbi:hypothetical protein [Desulfuromonas thiophila]|uniref:Double zinc ribbon n=1 Tax=Desulfuromonas thiophila TaxID=57664 RepID=A0A1G7EHI1_9BACT|nr:hypothetical protein [Desulfuromonas thiophila]SDE63027.1 hypothetical protein SAMN05661003_12029 [Desulfuromonas thiophila]